MNALDLTYRKTAAVGAGGFALLIALYNTLAGDLRRAARAQRAGDLEQRTEEVKHAIVVVASLENWIDAESGELAQWLIGFYASLRRRMIEAQSRQSAELLESLMTEVLDLRGIWQQLERETKNASAEPLILPPVATQRQGAFSSEAELQHMSWRA